MNRCEEDSYLKEETRVFQEKLKSHLPRVNSPYINTSYIEHNAGIHYFSIILIAFLLTSELIPIYKEEEPKTRLTVQVRIN